MYLIILPLKKALQNFQFRFQQEFKGNTDFNRVKKNIFKPSIVAKIIRIVPIAYKSYPVKHMCVRAELYGCPYEFGNIMLHSHTLNFLPRVHVTCHLDTMLCCKFGTFLWNHSLRP